LGHPYTATSVARAFFDGIVRLHSFRLPSSVTATRSSWGRCGVTCSRWRGSPSA
jgi:hypothetical protein